MWEDMPRRFVDAHVHLSDPDFKKELPHIFAFLNRGDVLLLSNSMDLPSSMRNLQLARLLDGNLLPFVGIHPWCINRADVNEFEQFVTKEEKRIAGIGEVGLDGKNASTDDAHSRQLEVFRRMLELAEKLGRPISVHSRASQKEVISLLPSYRIRSVLLHWFSGDFIQLKRAADRGYYVSYGPTIIYSKRSMALAERTAKEFILTETDGPVRYSCFGNRAASPIFLPSVVFALSSVLRSSFHEAMTMIEKNASAYLGRGLELSS